MDFNNRTSVEMCSLQNIEGVRSYCLSLPLATEDFPFDETTLVFRVMDKIFAAVDLEKNEWITLKCDPDYAIELRDRHAEISGAWHWNKKYWNQLHLPALSSALIGSLIRHSYDEVVKKMTRKTKADHPELLSVSRQLRIEHTNLATDYPDLQRIFAVARQFMATHGNPTQWTPDYPSQEQLERDCAAGSSYVCRNNRGHIVATFCFLEGDDPTYHKIYQGQWLNDVPYGVVHRLASDGTQQGIGREVFAWCLSRCSNLRVDTHADNTVLQHLLLSLGFRYCGIILCHNGTERLAYQTNLK